METIPEFRALHKSCALWQHLVGEDWALRRVRAAETVAAAFGASGPWLCGTWPKLFLISGLNRVGFYYLGLM